MPEFAAAQLDDFVDCAIRVGLNWGHPEMSSRFGDLRLKYETDVDQNLDPMSDAYMRQQLDLYQEIAGRPIDQESGELHPVDIEALVHTANPKGLADVNDVGENSRCILTMLSLASLSGSPHVLDLGAGHGVSSEVLAYAGCRVHAVDIDPSLSELSRRRAEIRGLDLVRTTANYDDLATLPADTYDAAFFFQSLHHCLTPWRLIGHLRASLKAAGVIAFAGEPMQTIWWRNWGLRLDPESLYVARRFGWFESGWSHAFLVRCFTQAGMHLDFFNGGNGGGEIGIATSTPERRAAVRATAVTLGLRCREQGFPIAETRYATLTGSRADLAGRPGFRQNAAGNGYLLYGPYASLDAGEWTITLLVNHVAGASGELEIDVTRQQIDLAPRQLIQCGGEEAALRTITFRLSLSEALDSIEVRARHSGSASWHVSLPTIEPFAGAA